MINPNNPFLPSAELQSTDALPVMKTSPETLDFEKVREHIERAVSQGRYQGASDIMEYLLEHKCLVPIGGDLYATLAGVICFGRDPQASFPRAVVDIGHYRGTLAVSDDVLHLEKNIGGTIFEQLNRLEDYLWGNTHHGMTVSETSMQRVDIHEYPRIVIRELGVNLLAHRDYTNYLSAARVLLFRDRIEWVSPGGLPPGMTINNLLEAQASRNPMILSILYESGYMEAFGQGLDTVVATLAREKMDPARFRDDGSFFIVTIHGRNMGMVANATLAGPLNANQLKILEFVRRRGEASTEEILKLFDDRGKRSIQRDLKGLVDANLITALGKSQALRYIPTETPI
jgi:ATP-dependent DNA helicase RecG